LRGTQCGNLDVPSGSVGTRRVDGILGQSFRLHIDHTLVRGPIVRMQSRRGGIIDHFMSAAHRGHPAQAISFRFERLILYDRHAGAEGVCDSPGALLHHVGEFVTEKELAVRRMRVVLAGGEVQVRAPGERDGPDGRSLRPDVDPDIGEVGAERGLHLGLNVTRQRPSAGLGSEIDLEGIYARTVLRSWFHLHGAGAGTHDAGVNGGK